MCFYELTTPASRNPGGPQSLVGACRSSTTSPMTSVAKTIVLAGLVTAVAGFAPPASSIVPANQAKHALLSKAMVLRVGGVVSKDTFVTTASAVFALFGLQVTRCPVRIALRSLSHGAEHISDLAGLVCTGYRRAHSGHPLHTRFLVACACAESCDSARVHRDGISGRESNSRCRSDLYSRPRAPT